jgi:hypothetical protein
MFKAALIALVLVGIIVYAMVRKSKTSVPVVNGVHESKNPRA